MKIANKISKRKFIVALASLASGILASFVFLIKGKKTSMEISQKVQTKKNEDLNPMTSNSILRTMTLDFQWQTIDPFIFCVHHMDFYPKGNKEFGPEQSLLQGRNIGQDFTLKDGFRMYHGSVVPGFPSHPHRGFETITIVERGLVDHSDSHGGAGRYGGGDVQWMTAGQGIQHAEMFPLVESDQDNTLELFQIWLNLPAKNKMVEAHYKMLWRDKLPVVHENDNKVRIKIIAGSYKGITPPSPPPSSWASDPNNKTQIWLIDLQPNTKWTLPAGDDTPVNSVLYFFEGKSLKVNNKSFDSKMGFVLNANSETYLETSDHEARLLLLQSRPINEEVVQYGPFVMNSKEEIQQAFHDYQRTGFGGWPWDRKDPVHGSKARFARHPAGNEEVPT